MRMNPLIEMIEWYMIPMVSFDTEEQQQKPFTTGGKDKLVRIRCLLTAEARMRLPRLHTCMLAQTHNHTAMPYSAQGINCLNQLLEENDDKRQKGD